MAEGGRARAGEAFVAGSLTELAAMCVRDGTPVPKWLQEGMAHDVDGTWPEWWARHEARLASGEPYSPNGMLVQAAEAWSERTGTPLSATARPVTGWGR